MNHATPPCAHAQAATPSPAGELAAATGERLLRLFSASLKQGRLHPLYMPLLNYRGAGSAAG